MVLKVLKNGLDETNDAGALADKYNKLKERIDNEIRELKLSNKSKVNNGDQLMNKTIGKSSCLSPPPSPVDVVYTWVNGSDPNFQASLGSTDLGAKTNKQDVTTNRFEDFNQLLYSVRSIEMYAPWVRKIWVATNGQHATWLYEGNVHIEVVPHEKIFQTKDDLPTFNFHGIEVHLHQIPGLS